MTTPTVRALWPRVALLSAAAAVAGSLTAVGLLRMSWQQFVDSYTFTNLVIGVVLTISGAFIGVHRPDNAVGTLLAAAGGGHLVSAVAGPVGTLGVLDGWPEPLTRVLATLFLVGWNIGLPTLFLLALLLFPDGRLPSPRWRRAAWLIVVLLVWSVVTSAINPVEIIEGEPGSRSLLAWSGFLPIFDVVTVVLAALPLIPVGAGFVVRYRRGDERTRRQLLWLILAVGGVFLINAQRWATGDGPIIFLVSILLLPVALTIAIVRYQLLDIRVVLSRALLYGVLIALVVGLFAALVAVFTATVPADADRTVTAAAAVTVALTLNPLRVLLQRIISRVFYGQRGDPAGTAALVGRHDLDDLDGVLEQLRRALRLPRLAVVEDGTEIAAAGPSADDHRQEILPLVLRRAGADDDQVGTLLVTLRAGERALHSDDRTALEATAASLALLLRERMLTAAVRSARAQTVQARERERLLLHRDLHDGLGPTLTGAALRLDAAANLLDPDPARARELLTDVRGDVRLAIAEVRRVVYGLRPLALDERGLLGALAEHVDRDTGLPAELVVDEPLPPLSPAVELAAYRIAVEGIVNARRHSDGTTVTVDLSVCDDHLVISVTDDGRAPTTWTPGVGIRSVAERAEELGGRAEVGPAAHGWTVRALLPLQQ